MILDAPTMVELGGGDGSDDAPYDVRPSHDGDLLVALCRLCGDVAATSAWWVTTRKLWWRAREHIARCYLEDDLRVYVASRESIATAAARRGVSVDSFKTRVRAHGLHRYLDLLAANVPEELARRWEQRVAHRGAA